MKSETGSKQIEEFVGLRAKLYGGWKGGKEM
jgi:hypothetical protein